MKDTLTATIDTLHKVVCDGNIVYLIKPSETWFSTTITVGDMIAILSMIGSIIVFWWQLNKSRKENRENIRSTWFLRIIVEPNMTMIDAFYANIIEKVDKITKDLYLKYEQNCTAKELHNELSKQQRFLKKEKESNLGQFQILLRVSHPTISTRVDDELDKLVDIITKHVQSYEQYNEEYSVKESVLENKCQIVSELYKGWKGLS